MTAVFHAAVAVSLASRGGHDLADLALVLGAKAGGAAVLDELTAGREPGRDSCCSPRSRRPGAVAEHGRVRGGQRLPGRARGEPPRARPARDVGGLGAVASGGRIDERAGTAAEAGGAPGGA